MNFQVVTYPVECWTTHILPGSSSCWLVVWPPYPYKGSCERFGWTLRAALFPYPVCDR